MCIRDRVTGCTFALLTNDCGVLAGVYTAPIINAGQLALPSPGNISVTIWYGGLPMIGGPSDLLEVLIMNEW